MAMQHLIDGVFSGSGMDLLDHAGAAWGLSDAGYEFVSLAGVSGGSIIAMALASGFRPGPELNDLIMSFLPVSTKLLDPEIKWPWSKDSSTKLKDALPWWWPLKNHGAVKGDKLIKAITEKLKTKGVIQFKDIKKPLKVFTTDMTIGAQVEWSQDTSPNAAVAPVIVASCRIPGVFQEAYLNGHKHVDGGVWANFPVDCFNKQPDGSSDGGEGTVGFFFGIDVNIDDGLGFWPSLINVMMASRMAEDVEDSPKAKIIKLPGGNSLDFGIQGDKARAKIEVARKLAVQWAADQAKLKMVR